MQRALLAAVWAAGCLTGQVVPDGVPLSLGRPQAGILRSARALPARGDGYVFVRDRARAFGSAALVGLIERSTAQLRRQAPGPALRVGDLSAASGGRLEGHGSHRTGRDADILFPMTDVAGSPLASSGMPVAMSGFAIREGALHRLDVRRTWTFFRVLLTDPQVPVQWLFVSRGVKSLLVEHALRTGEDRALVARAVWVLHQPSDGRPHDDHVHVRVYCSAVERAYGCEDGAPVWPWHEKAVDGGGPTGSGDGDLVRDLLAEP